MKKNKCLLNLVLTLILCLTINVKADNLGYYLSNSELNYNYDSAPSSIKVKRGDYIYVTAIINDSIGSNLNLSSGKVTVRWDEKSLELVAVSNDTYYSVVKSDFKNLDIKEDARTNNRITLSYETDEAIKQGVNKLMEFKFHVLSDAKTGEVKIYELDGETSINCISNEEKTPCGNSYNSELKYTIEGSNVNTLSSLKIDGNIIEGFSENKKEYNVSFEGTKQNIDIEGILKDSRATISGDIGRRELEYGLNKFNIDVTSETGEKNTYIINVTRHDSRSKDNTLKDLKISSGIIPFKSNINDYNVSVKNEIDTITIIAILNDTKAKFKDDYSKKEIDLEEGINKVSITVIAENNEENTYNINITRELSSNNTLKELTINDNKIKLSKSEFLYYYTVGNEVENVSIKAVANDNNATVEIDPIPPLVVGENGIGIKVTAPNGDSVNYTVMVIREQLLSSNAKLSNLEVVGYKLDFDKDKLYYDLVIKDENSLDLIYDTEDDKATVTIEGNKNLVNGSIIKINVKAEDNSIVRYFINIEKETKSNSLLLIIILVIMLIILIISIILIINKKKKNKSKVVKEEKLEKTIDLINSVNDLGKEQNDIIVNTPSEEESSPIVDLDKTIVVTDLNKVLDEEESDNTTDRE